MPQPENTQEDKEKKELPRKIEEFINKKMDDINKRPDKNEKETLSEDYEDEVREWVSGLGSEQIGPAMSYIISKINSFHEAGDKLKSGEADKVISEYRFIENILLNRRREIKDAA